MTDFDIREMTTDDIDPAVELYRSGGWGERRSFLEQVAAVPSCKSLVAVRDGSVVATGLATINGPVGWVGSIFVDPRLRRQGLGKAMTEAVCARLDAAGCRTQALIASVYGQPLYEKMGFRIDAWYQILEALPSDAMPVPRPGATLRRMVPGDLDRVGRLDRRATGEDRRGLLGGMAESGWLLESGADLLGFLVSILPDSAAVVAPDPDDAVVLLDLLRHLGRRRARTVRAAVLQGHDKRRRLLEERGWGPTFVTPRMLRGDPIDWQPEMSWGLLGFAFG